MNSGAAVLITKSAASCLAPQPRRHANGGRNEYGKLPQNELQFPVPDLTELPKTLLLVEDNEQIRQVWADFFRRENYTVIEAATAERGKLAAMEAQPDLIIIDWLLPDGDGAKSCQELRERGVTCPIVMMTCRDTEEAIVTGLDCGADDYWVKPIKLKEAAARVKALLRRRCREDAVDDSARIGTLRIDRSRRQVWLRDRRIELNAKEFDILDQLAQAKGAVLTRAQLFATAWKHTSLVKSRSLDNYVMTLRRKIEENAARPKLLLTVRGKGYRLSLEDPMQSSESTSSI